MSIFWRAFALILVAVASNCLGADELTLEPQDGVLVLRNGFVLQGRITPVNDMFLVTIDANGEVRLPRADVEFQCRSLDEAYLRQRDSLASDEPAAHLGLADWCLRHGLLARAADQLLIVLAQEPSHPRLMGVEQRLNSLGTRSMSAESGAKPRAEAIPQAATLTTKLSPQLMEQFTTVVQPILLNRCATYACHGNGATVKYRLVRPSTGHAATSRMTQRNLQATLLFMDHEFPEKSPLLEQGSLAHGGTKSPAFTDKHARQFDLLTAWVRRAAMRPVESITANSGGPKRLGNRIASKPAAESPPAPAGTKSAVEPVPAVIPAGYAESAKTPRPAAPASPADDPTGRDPFDPEIFNRRYHPPNNPPANDAARDSKDHDPKR